MRIAAQFFPLGPVFCLGLLVPGLGGQEPGCPPCEVRLTKVVELSSRLGVFEPSLANSVARFSGGSYVVSPLFVEPHLLLYGTDGRLLSTYDRLGSGPGELESTPSVFLGRGDTLLAVDRNRLLRFDSDLNTQGTSRLGSRIVSTLVVLSDGSMVTNGRQRMDAELVSPISILGPDGTIRRSLEPIGAQYAVGATLVTESSGGGFWLMRSNDSEIRRRSSAGGLEFTVEIQREWFEPWTEFLPGEGISVPPRPYNSSISEFSQGRLLVTAWVADQEWEPAGRATGRFRPQEENTSNAWDTIIEFFDRHTGGALASTRTDQTMWKVEGTKDHFFSAREDDDGHVTLEIWKVALAPMTTTDKPPSSGQKPTFK